MLDFAESFHEEVKEFLTELDILDVFVTLSRF